MRLGLVCITRGDAVRYRTITRTRFLSLSEASRREAIDSIYQDNVQTLYRAVDFCAERQIRLYRATSALFPQVDHPAGRAALDRMEAIMAGFGGYARDRGVRVVLHPDQYVVINSASPQVVEQSVGILENHAMVFDRLGLERSSWAAMNIHGGKGGRAEELVSALRGLPENVRSRITLENDESAYGAEEILKACREAGVPMIFDAHHHVVREKLSSYEDESVGRLTAAARGTWPEPEWQIVHLSNGLEGIGDSRHSDRISVFPSAFTKAPWIEVEAKGKEEAIEALRRLLRRGKGRERNVITKGEKRGI